MSEQRAPQQNGCQCGMCFFLAMEGSKYCVAHRGIMEAFDRKRAASLPDSQPQGERVQVTPLCRCPEGVCLMHPNSPGYDKKCSLRHPESQPSPSGDFHKELREKISLIKLYPDMDAQEFYERMEEFIVRVLRSHDAKVSGQAEKRLKKIKSIVEDPARKVEYGTPEYYLLQRLSVALQESPSDK